jgi:hypothetical protein
MMKDVNVVYCNSYNEALVLKERLENKYDQVEIVFGVEKDSYGNDVSDKTAVAYGNN